MNITQEIIFLRELEESTLKGLNSNGIIKIHVIMLQNIIKFHFI